MAGCGTTPGEAPWKPFDSGSEPGFVLVAGRGEGRTRAEAREAALQDAARQAASTVGTRVEAQFDRIETTFAAYGGGGESTEQFLSDARSRVHTRTSELLRGGVPRDCTWAEGETGGLVCHVRLRFPVEQVFPQAALAELVDSGAGAPQKVRRALALVDRYEVDGFPDLARAAASLAARWAPGDPAALRVLADVLARQGDYLGAVEVLERLRDQMEEDAREQVQRRIDRVTRHLLSPDEIQAILVRRCERERRTDVFWLQGETRSAGVVFSFRARRDGYLTCLWMDADGVGEWTPTDAARGSNFWEAGEHRLQPVKLSAPAATVVAFFSESPFSFTDAERVPVPADSFLEGKTAGLRKLYRLKRFVEAKLSEPGVSVDVVKLSR